MGVQYIIFAKPMFLLVVLWILVLPLGATDLETNFYGSYKPHPRPYDRVLDFLPPSKLSNLEQAKKLLVQTAKIMPETKNRKPLSELALKTRIRKSLKLDWLFKHIEKTPPRFELIDEHPREGYVEQKFKISDTIIGSFPVLVLLPTNTHKKAPAILGLHGHGGSMEDFRDILMGARLAREGYAVVIVRFRAMYNLYEHEISQNLMRRGYNLMGFRVFEALLSLEILKNHPLIQAKKWGILAHSGGSAIAHLLVRLVEGISACVSDYDSSYHFPWQELCCEAVPELALLGTQLNQRSNFPCPALKAPYHFSPKEDQILQFLRTYLGQGVNHSLGNIEQDNLIPLIQAKASAGYGQGSPALRKRLDLQTEILFSDFSQTLQNQGLGPVKDQRLFTLIQALLLLDDWRLALKASQLFSVPKNRLQAISTILTLSNPKSIRSKEILAGTARIHQELGKFESSQDSARIRIQISKSLANNGLETEALRLLKADDLRHKEVLNKPNLREMLLECFQKLLIHGGNRKTTISVLDNYPKKFRFQAFSRSIEKILNPELRKSLRLILRKTLLRDEPTGPVDQILFSLGLSRIFSQPPAGLRPLSEIPELRSEQAMELGRELIYYKDWKTISMISNKLLGLQDQIEFLLRILALASKNDSPKPILKDLGQLFDQVDNPATLCGFYEEILEILLENGHDTDFRFALTQATIAVKRIEAPFDKQTHIRNLVGLAIDQGSFNQGLALVHLVPVGYDSQSLKNKIILKQAQWTEKKSEPIHGKKSSMGPINSTLALVTHASYARLIKLHSASRNTLDKALKKLPMEERLGHQMELAKAYADRGFLVETEDLLEIIIKENHNQTTKVRFQVIREVSNIFSILGNDNALHNCLRSYLRTLAGMLPTSAWVEPGLRLMEEPYIRSRIPKVFFQAFFTWLLKHTHWENESFPAFCIQVYEEDKTTYFVDNLKGVCEEEEF